MKATLTTTGVREARSRIDHMGARARAQTHTFESEGRRAQRLITGIPVDSGRLAASVRGGPDSELETGPWGFAILTRVPYAPFVFRGTSAMRARPPVVPRATIARSTSQAVARDLDRAR